MHNIDEENSGQKDERTPLSVTTHTGGDGEGGIDIDTDQFIGTTDPSTDAIGVFDDVFDAVSYHSD